VASSVGAVVGGELGGQPKAQGNAGNEAFFPWRRWLEQELLSSTDDAMAKY
jgi:hypothetical protein